MLLIIKQTIEKHVLAYQPRPGKCVMFYTDGVREVANELGIEYKAAEQLVRNWIHDTF